MPEHSADKKHEATPFRRQQAREQGQIARSQDLASAMILVGAVALLIYSSHGLARFLRDYTEHQLRSASVRPIDAPTAAHWLVLAGWELGRVLLPLLGMMTALAIVAHVLQSGFLFLPQRLALDWNHINPLRGFQRIFSLPNVIRLGFGLLKTLVVLATAAWCVWAERENLLAAASLATEQMPAFFVELVLWTCFKIGAALLVLALLDYLFQYWKHEQDLRMTDQELREELRNMQGDPQILARRRAIQRQLVVNRLSAIVPTADFVVTNPTELAVAIRYDLATMAAPIVVAKGAGVLAQRIRRLALEHGVPIVERKELARFLYQQVELNQPIPIEQYAAVAEILRYVYQLKGKTLPRVA